MPETNYAPREQQEPRNVVIQLIPPKVPYRVRAAFQAMGMCHEMMGAMKRRDGLDTEAIEMIELHPAAEDLYITACVEIGRYLRRPDPEMLLTGEDYAEATETDLAEQQEDVGEVCVRGENEAGGEVQGLGPEGE